MFDIIFMSYEEPNAEEHWEAVKQKYPWARRVHGVKGLVKNLILVLNQASTIEIQFMYGEQRIVLTI